ncbi:hypothetical protein [Sorangium sp. So ce1097]|uniref:hypothetical protein n=1 Tax=Sorangium sp. So ce1097 TaxID=3133330 RepID=UPI003F5EF35B
MTYHESQQRIAEAEAAQRDGDLAKARTLFLQAAELQRNLIAAVPDDRVRTKSVFGLSVATLLYKADELDESERYACHVLSHSWVESYSAAKLRELVAHIWDERVLRSRKIERSRRPTSVLFRGGTVGRGIAPAGAIDAHMRTIRSLTNRLADYKNERPLTPKSAQHEKELYQAFDSQPSVSSYKIDMYLATTGQISFSFDGRQAVSPEEILDSVISFVEVAVVGDTNEVRGLVEDTGYQLALARLTRGLIPDGYDIGEIELRRMSSDGRERSVRVLHAHRLGVNSLIREATAASLATQRGADNDVVDRDELIGTLRAVDLDRRRIRVEVDGGASTVILLSKDMLLDDVLGPMLNKRVKVVRQRMRGKRMWHADDVEPV